METAEDELGIEKEVSSFVLPLGATINMDGTALYQAVATMFIAQVLIGDISFTAQIGIVLTATLASIGAAGVPSAGIIILVVVLEGVLAGSGIDPAAGIALILGVDRILDMCRTAVNVTGDLTAAAVIERSEYEHALRGGGAQVGLRGSLARPAPGRGPGGPAVLVCGARRRPGPDASRARNAGRAASIRCRPGSPTP